MSRIVPSPGHTSFPIPRARFIMVKTSGAFGQDTKDHMNIIWKDSRGIVEEQGLPVFCFVLRTHMILIRVYILYSRGHFWQNSGKDIGSRGLKFLAICEANVSLVPCKWFKYRRREL